MNLRFCVRRILFRIGQRAQNWPLCADLTKQHRNCKVFQVLYNNIALSSALTAATASSKHFDVKNKIKQQEEVKQTQKCTQHKTTN